MGRMLDTLKHGDGKRVIVAPAMKPAEEATEQERVVDWEIGAEVPYVEVGGPNKKVELSPGLMKHSAQNVPHAPHLSVEAAPKPKVVNLTATQPMTVAFEPWPGAGWAPQTVSPEIIAYHHAEHASSKEYAGLLDAMLASMKNGAGPVLLLVGVRPNVGASTVLLNLGVIAAQAKKLRVALIDVKPARAGLAQRLGCAVSTGLSEVLDGSLALEQAIVKTGIAALSVLPAGNKQLLVSSEALAWLLGWLRERNDLILIDGPTLDAEDSLARHVPHAHGTYLVMPRGESVPLGKGVAQSISGMGGRLCGLIHTHFE
jgi:Mrp family chromosome partitioning ATPase